MKCIKCNTEMEDGYILQLSVGGNIKIAKANMFSNASCPNVIVCPKCGKVELYIDYNGNKKVE